MSISPLPDFTAGEVAHHDDINRVVSERVNQLMFVKRVTQTTLAPYLGISASSLSLKIRGRVGWSLAELTCLAGALGVTMNDLVPQVVPDTLPVRGKRKPQSTEVAGADELVASGGVEPPTFRFSVERSTN